jgi:diguanylate cyclase (GGDEF)-like protein
VVKPVSPNIINQLQRINHLRWLFVGVFVLVTRFSLESSDWFSVLALPVGAAIFVLLVFEWLHHHLAHSNGKYFGQHAITILLFGQVVLDIGFITFGIGATGGSYSLLPLVYVLYFGALESFFSPFAFLAFNALAILSYIGILFVQAWGWLPPSPPIGLQFSNKPYYEFMLLVLVLNVVLAMLRSRKNNQQRWKIEFDNAFLTNLNLLSRTAIDDINDKMAFIGLADKIKTLLEADNIYLTHWDEDSERVISLAADSTIHEFYMKLPPTPRYENTFTRSVKQAGRLVLAENVFCSPYISPRVAGHFSARSVLAAPLFGKPENRFMGALLVAFKQPHYFSSHEIARIHQVIDILSLLISRTWLHQEAIRRAELLEKMAGQVTNLVSDLKHTTLLPSIVESARSLLQAQRAALHLQQKNGEMKCEYSVGLSDEFLEQLTRRFNQFAGGKILHNREFVIIPDVHQDSRTSPVQDLIFGEKFRAYAVFSLNSEHEQKGALSLYWDQPYVVSTEEVAVGKLFAERASAILRSAHIYARATEEALTDILTDLPNRRHLDQRIKDEIERASRYEHTFALLMIDLDGFKAINDTFGHPIGDSVLKQVAVALRRTLRASDFLARYGGDEFSIILPETGLERAMHVAEKLRLALSSTRLHLPQETQRYLSGCMGIAIYPKDCQSVEDILVCADRRLYRAKRSGLSSIIYTDD